MARKVAQASQDLSAMDDGESPPRLVAAAKEHALAGIAARMRKEVPVDYARVCRITRIGDV